MSDLLTSASLLLTVITVMYSIWIQDIKTVLDIKRRPHGEDRLDDFEEVKKVIHNKSIPLTVSAWVLSLIFVPETIKIIISSFYFLAKNGFGSINYNAVVLTFIVINLVFFALSVLTTQHLLWLNKKAIEIDPKS